MTLNTYCRLSHFKREAGSITSTADDTYWLQLLERASRQVDDWCHRSFVAVTATRYLDGNGKTQLWLRPGDELITASSFTVDDNGDDTYEITLVVDTDYFLWPYNVTNGPRVRLDINPNSSKLGVWPNARRALKITGSWGYSAEWESVVSTISEDLDASETGIDVNDGTLWEKGDTALCGSEQVAVSSIATNTLTVVRGINGTTAATHSSGAALTLRRYPRTVEQATAGVALRWAWAAQTGIGGGSAPYADSDGSLARQFYPMLRDLTAPHRTLVVG